jgi:hypothetical protein
VGRHPTDTQREADALPALERFIGALRRGDAGGAAALLRDDVAWLGPEGTGVGPAAATAHLERLARAGLRWWEPQQQGAKAVLRHGAPDGGRGALVVEVRRGLLVFVAET